MPHHHPPRVRHQILDFVQHVLRGLTFSALGMAIVTGAGLAVYSSTNYLARTNQSADLSPLLGAFIIASVVAVIGTAAGGLHRPGPHQPRPRSRAVRTLIRSGRRAATLLVLTALGFMVIGTPTAALFGLFSVLAAALGGWMVLHAYRPPAPRGVR